MRLALCLVVPTLILGICYALLSACSSGTPSRAYVPVTSAAMSRSLIQFDANRLPACETHGYNAPGQFIVLAALGTFSGSSFSDSGLSLWTSISLAKGHKEIQIIHLPIIRNQYTIYYGTYKLSNGLVGCFYLAKVKYQGVSFDGVAAAAPRVYDFGKATPAAEGPVAIAIKGISAKSGSGTLSLKDASTGKIIDTGTVRIEHSLFVP
jgi:hypothetical protein